MSKLITARLLRSKRACADQVALFKRHFLEGVIPSLELVPWFAGLFDFNWAARNLLSPEGRAAYYAATASAWDAYEDAIDSAQDAYKAAIASSAAAYKAATVSAANAYDAVCVSAEAAYYAATASAWDAYQAARVSVLATYQATIALAFVEAWLSQTDAEIATLDALQAISASRNTGGET